MKTMLCPFCGKEIKEEAILCKYCHNLLIDENGNLLPPQNEEVAKAVTETEVDTEPEAPAEETAETEETTEPAGNDSDDDNDGDKTLVYSKEELKKAMEEAAAASISADEITEQAEKNLAENDGDDDENASDDVVYIEDSDDETKVYTDDSEPDSEEETIDDSEYDSKRVFAITAIITLGILILIIAAVAVGWKLFGFSGDDSSSQTTTTVPAVLADSSEPDDDSFEAYVPQVTDDTTSEDPEEIANSEQADPVTETESIASDESALDSVTDSTEDSATDSSDDSTASINADDTPSFEPAGSYYSWNEALQLWANFKTNHGYDDESKYYTNLSYCPDDYTMVFLCREVESGTSNYYSLDLYTGTFTPVE